MKVKIIIILFLFQFLKTIGKVKKIIIAQITLNKNLNLLNNQNKMT